MKHVFRRLLRSPMFTRHPVTLAIGNRREYRRVQRDRRVLLKPLPYPHPEELVLGRPHAPASTSKELPTLHPVTSSTGADPRVPGHRPVDKLHRQRHAPGRGPNKFRPQRYGGILGISACSLFSAAPSRAKDDTPGSPIPFMLSYGSGSANRR